MSGVDEYLALNNRVVVERKRVLIFLQKEGKLGVIQRGIGKKKLTIWKTRALRANISSEGKISRPTAREGEVEGV